MLQQSLALTPVLGKSAGLPIGQKCLPEWGKSNYGSGVSTIVVAIHFASGSMPSCGTCVSASIEFGRSLALRHKALNSNKKQEGVNRENGKNCTLSIGKMMNSSVITVRDKAST
jgi:hypothetical protein